jgi:hypothetical protein
MNWPRKDKKKTYQESPSGKPIMKAFQKTTYNSKKASRKGQKGRPQEGFRKTNRKDSRLRSK